MKVRFILLCCFCIITALFVCCINNIDAVRKVAYNDIDIQTKYGDQLHFDISSHANMHHQFIEYKISLLNKSEDQDSMVEIVLRDLPEAVYNNPISIFSEISSEQNISLYKLEDNYIFVYGGCIALYSAEDDLFAGYSEIDVIERFKEVVLNNQAETIDNTGGRSSVLS